MVLGDSGQFRLSGRVAARLYAHQAAGVAWLYSLLEARKGGILADDMVRTVCMWAGAAAVAAVADW
jgi:hypothetical protein